MADVPKMNPREITPPTVYFHRRRLLRGTLAAASLGVTAGTYRWFNPWRAGTDAPIEAQGGTEARELSAEQVSQGWPVDEPWTTERHIINYNNFYEFSTQKDNVAALAAQFRTDGWTVMVDGLVDRPRNFSVDQILALSVPEERVYRMRCVEAWSMVIPWLGIPLAHVLDAVSPLPDAKYIAFETLYDPTRMPGQKFDVLEWPYVEGLRLDEARHPLTLLATGLYGKPLPPQDGAPLRLVVPWKYGFKGIKSIVRMTLVAEQPGTSWNRYAPSEYGFYANVNPQVDHPRWSQATEQRIGEAGRRKTLLFNGYEQQVAELYAGLDLRDNF